VVQAEGLSEVKGDLGGRIGFLGKRRIIAIQGNPRMGKAPSEEQRFSQLGEKKVLYVEEKLGNAKKSVRLTFLKKQTSPIQKGEGGPGVESR